MYNSRRKARRFESKQLPCHELFGRQSREDVGRELGYREEKRGGALTPPNLFVAPVGGFPTLRAVVHRLRSNLNFYVIVLGRRQRDAQRTVSIGFWRVDVAVVLFRICREPGNQALCQRVAIRLVRHDNPNPNSVSRGATPFLRRALEVARIVLYGGTARAYCDP
jgi:hypothetical protein